MAVQHSHICSAFFQFCLAWKTLKNHALKVYYDYALALQRSFLITVQLVASLVEPALPKTGYDEETALKKPNTSSRHMCTYRRIYCSCRYYYITEYTTHRTFTILKRHLCQQLAGCTSLLWCAGAT